MLMAISSLLRNLVKISASHLSRLRRYREGGNVCRQEGGALDGRRAALYSMVVAAAEVPDVARERRLEARQVEEIFIAFAEAMRELPPDVEAGWLDAQGDLRLAPDIARKLRTARRVRQLLAELRQSRREG
jgi:hypothetical protein